MGYFRSESSNGNFALSLQHVFVAPSTNTLNRLRFWANIYKTNEGFDYKVFPEFYADWSMPIGQNCMPIGQDCLLTLKVNAMAWRDK